MKNYLVIDRVASSGVLVAKVWGDVTMETALELLKDLYTLECEYPQGFRRFTDLGSIQSIGLNTEEIRIITEKRRLEYQGPPVRSSIFARHPITYGMMRMYSSMIEPSPIDVNVFYTIGECANWIGATLEEIMPEGEADH